MTLPGSIATRLRHAREDLPDQRKADLAQGPPHDQVRRPVPALQPAALLRGQQRAARLHHLQRRVHRHAVPVPSPTSCSTRCRARAGAAATRTIPWTHLQNRTRLFAQDDFKLTRAIDPESWAALGLHVAARREGQPPDELRPRHRPADLREGWQHRGSRALQAVLQGLRAAARRRLAARPTTGSSAAATASRSSWKAPAPTCGCR